MRHSRELCFFVPTTAGELVAVASLPSAGELKPPGMVLLGGALLGPPLLERALREAGRVIAGRGHPVLRVGYPGVGLAPLSEPLPRKQLDGVVAEAVAWFKELIGIEEVSLGGTCGGALRSLMLARRDPSARAVVAVDCPVRPRGPARSALRKKVSRFDAVAATLGKRLASGPQTRPRSQGWVEGLPLCLDELSGRTRLEFVYGSEDEFLGDLEELLASDEISESTRHSIAVTVLPGVKLRGTRDLEHHGWIRDRLISGLVPAE